MKTDKLEYIESFVVRFLQIKVMWRKKYRHDKTIYFTSRRKIMQGRWNRERAQDTGPPILNWNKKHSFLFFPVFLINDKSILKQQYSDDVVKSAKMDVSELLKFQKFICPQVWLNQS